jgi:hypothetical protein
VPASPFPHEQEERQRQTPSRLTTSHRFVPELHLQLRRFLLTFDSFIIHLFKQQQVSSGPEMANWLRRKGYDPRKSVAEERKMQELKNR